MTAKNVVKVNKKLIKNVKIEDIKPYKNNYLDHSKNVEYIKHSIKELGYIKPIVADERMVILAGHGAYHALKELGYKEIPEIYLIEGMKEKDKKAYRIADNESARGSVIINDILKSELEDLNFDFEKIGFDVTEFDIQEEVQEDEFDIESVKSEPIVKAGDIFLLNGKHRIMCGDSTVERDVEQLMDGKKADMVFTDPPYGMFLNTDYSKIKGSAKSIGFKGNKRGNKYEKMKGDNEDFSCGLIQSIFANFDYCKEVFIFGADYFIDLLPNYGKDGCLLVWNKRSSDIQQKGIGNCFELFWSKIPHKKYVFNFEWFGFLSKEAPQEARNRVHPSMKPIGLIVRIWTWYKSPQGIVADLFLGSGSTLIACEQTGRICYGMELDEHYIEVILNRYHKLFPDHSIECLNRPKISKEVLKNE